MNMVGGNEDGDDGENDGDGNEDGDDNGNNGGTFVIKKCFLLKWGRQLYNLML